MSRILLSRIPGLLADIPEPVRQDRLELAGGLLGRLVADLQPRLRDQGTLAELADGQGIGVVLPAVGTAQVGHGLMPPVRAVDAEEDAQTG